MLDLLLVVAENIKLLVIGPVLAGTSRLVLVAGFSQPLASWPAGRLVSRELPRKTTPKARVMLKANGSVTVYTTDDATAKEGGDRIVVHKKLRQDRTNIVAVAGHFKVIHPWTLESDSPVDRGES